MIALYEENYLKMFKNSVVNIFKRYVPRRDASAKMTPDEQFENAKTSYKKLVPHNPPKAPEKLGFRKK